MDTYPPLVELSQVVVISALSEIKIRPPWKGDTSGKPHYAWVSVVEGLPVVPTSIEA